VDKSAQTLCLGISKQTSFVCSKSDRERDRERVRFIECAKENVCLNYECNKCNELKSRRLSFACPAKESLIRSTVTGQKKLPGRENGNKWKTATRIE